MSYTMKIGGNLPFGDRGDATQRMREGFSMFDKWRQPLMAQEKRDGWHAVCIKDVEGNISWEQGWERNSDLVEFLKIMDKFMPNDSVVCGEITYGTQASIIWIQKNGYMKITLFDVVRWGGQDLSGESAHVRFNFLERRCKEFTVGIKEIGVVGSQLLQYASPDLNREAAWNMFYEIVLNGGEGIVLKDAFGLYEAGKRSKKMWKCKKMVTKDYVVMGFSETKAPTYLAQGMKVATILCGLYRAGELKYTTQTSGFGFDYRKLFTDAPEKYIGRVIELGGNEVFTSGAMRHSFMIRFRDDKRPEECTM